MRNWQGANVFEGDGLRREVLYLFSGDADIFATVYAATETSGSFALLVFPGWGFEGITYRDAQHRLAIAMARRGGAGIAFDYPGQGESSGRAETAGIDALTRAALDAADHLRSRFEGNWIVAGIRVGAAVAALASVELRPSALLLVEPELDPGAHFVGVLARSRRATLNHDGSEGLAFGVPVSDFVLESAHNSAPAVRTALETLGCPIGSVRFDGPPSSPGPHVSGIAAITVAGTPEDRAFGQAPLVAAAVAWLDRTMESVG